MSLCGFTAMALFCFLTKIDKKMSPHLYRTFIQNA